MFIVSFLIKAVYTILFMLCTVGYIGLLAIFRVVERIFIGKSVSQKSNGKISPPLNVDPKLLRDHIQILKVESFSLVQYQFETSDGTLLDFWRIIPENAPSKLGEPVVLMHGLMSYSMSWFVNADKKKSLPYMLADKGFDVWIGNNRGNKISKKRKPDYWEYTFDHIVQFDFPTIVSSILQHTKYEKLSYIGHSQGGCQLLTGTGVKPETQNKIKRFIGLGTLISMDSLFDNSIMNFLVKTRILSFLGFVGMKTIYIFPQWVQKSMLYLMHNSDLFLTYYHGFIMALAGKTLKIELKDVAAAAAHTAGGCSLRNLEHMTQAVKRRKLGKFDYGKRRNLKLYGQQEPPVYDFSHLKEVPFECHLFHGTNDGIVSQKDFQKMVASLKQPHVYIVKDYAHMDFLWAKDVGQEIYQKVIQILSAP